MQDVAKILGEVILFLQIPFVTASKQSVTCVSKTPWNQTKLSINIESEGTYESLAFMSALATFDPKVISPLVSSLRIPRLFGLRLPAGKALNTIE
jgi:hypothetical protein